MAEGLEFTNYWTHSSPCSPSRASLITGQYVPQHGVNDNVIIRSTASCRPGDPDRRVSIVRDAGYRSSLHRQVAPLAGAAARHGRLRLHRLGGQRPPLHGLGRHRRALRPGHRRRTPARWLRANAASLRRAVVPHRRAREPARRDVVPDRPALLPAPATPSELADVAQLLDAGASGRTTSRCPLFTEDYDEVFEVLPANFDDDLHTKPEAHRQWRWDQQHGMWGYIDPADKKAWLRHLDYYVKLHRMADETSARCSSALDDVGRVGRHDHHLHVRPRRHVRLARPAVEGPVRLQRDHAGAAATCECRA